MDTLFKNIPALITGHKLCLAHVACYIFIFLLGINYKFFIYFSYVFYINFQVSEGLDFADQYGRAVVVTGLPFATRTDPKV